MSLRIACILTNAGIKAGKTTFLKQSNFWTYSPTSVARTPMAGLPWLFQTRF